MKSFRSVVGGTVLAASFSGVALAAPVLDPAAADRRDRAMSIVSSRHHRSSHNDDGFRYD